MMKRPILTCFFALLLTAMHCLAQKDRNPLSEQILSAKTVFLAGGTPDLLDIAAGELNKWGRFQVVSGPKESDVVFDFGLQWQPGQGFALETLAITGTRTGERLYWGDRVGHFAGWSRMTRSLLQDLRGRIEATESAHTLEYTIKFETRAAKYFTDAAALNERFAATGESTSAGSLKDKAKEWREFADQLAKSNSEMTKFLGHATVDDLLSKQGSGEVRKYRDEILAYTCSTLERNRGLEREGDELRPKLPPDVIQALDAEEADGAALVVDCGSELAIGLLKKQKGKPPSN
jgi:hypothetical protein